MRKNEQFVRILGDLGLPFTGFGLFLGLGRKATQTRIVQVSDHRKRCYDSPSHRCQVC